ncbi:hypothetical protein O4H49_20060 [Kiloniella laminariae]|uniref:Uncharacterized protein n=1 Tax=Kiloniella laminariae TaxID=454162 RepID=A0ABT4LPN2_9PROT|nr:hypothetical protein [Kiloniella laminariae]MCZ4283090.1 hypothetical protein [Kiloniella laminariae]
MSEIAAEAIPEEKSKHFKTFLVVGGGLLATVLTVALISGISGSNNRNAIEENIEEPAARPQVLQSRSFEESFKNYKGRFGEEQPVVGRVEEQPVTPGLPAWEQDLLQKKRKAALDALQGDMQVLEAKAENYSPSPVPIKAEQNPQLYVDQHQKEISNNISDLEARLKQLNQN